MDIFSVTDNEREVRETDFSFQKVMVCLYLGRGLGVLMVMVMAKWSEMARSKLERWCRVSPVE